MASKVVIICLRHSGLWGAEGSLRRQMQGIRAAWKRKYLYLQSAFYFQT